MNILEKAKIEVENQYKILEYLEKKKICHK